MPSFAAAAADSIGGDSKRGYFWNRDLRNFWRLSSLSRAMSFSDSGWTMREWPLPCASFANSAKLASKTSFPSKGMKTLVSSNRRIFKLIRNEFHYIIFSGDSSF